jgi:NADPH-dependent curcumin reductase CurA
METVMISREIRLASRPKGIPNAGNFLLAQSEVRPPQEHQVMVRNLFMSVDPYMRGRMNEGKSYVPSFELGEVLDGGAVGEVIESNAGEFKPGDIVTSNYGWREYFVAAPKELHRVSPETQPLSVYLGALGMTGMTAWAGLNLVEVKAGDVIYISGAAGAVGNVAGQLAKLRGCRVIGSAGSIEKVLFLRDECGFDVAFDYKVGSVVDQLTIEAPSGIDVYFDNVGGETLEAALTALREHGRIIACGGISGSRSAAQPVGHRHRRPGLPDVWRATELSPLVARAKCRCPPTTPIVGKHGHQGPYGARYALRQSTGRRLYGEHHSRENAARVRRSWRNRTKHVTRFVT